MAANIHNIYVCPRCDHEVTSPKPGTSCPECGLILGGKNGGTYQPPMPLSEQHSRLQNDGLHLHIVLGLRPEKCRDMFEDVVNILETLPAKKASLTDISPLVEMGIRIGEMAKAYREFLAAGGKHVPAVLANIEEDNRELSPPLTTAVVPTQENQYEHPTNGDRGGTSTST